VKGRGRDLKPSQLGCFASHYLLWQECAASGQPMVVVEDDAVLKDNFPDMLAYARQLSEAWPLIWLHEYDRPGKPDAFTIDRRIGPFTLVRKLKGHFCAVSYLLSPPAAEILLDYCRSWIYPVDDTMFRFYEHGVENIALLPPCVGQNHELPSDIRGGTDSPSLSLLEKVRREGHKARDTARRVLHNLRFRLCHKRSA